MPPQPWRGPAPGRPRVPLPPAHMPMWHGTRPLKRWRWVGCFTPELSLCVARALIGPAGLAWWAVWDRPAGTLIEATHRRPGGIAVEEGRAHVAEGLVAIDLHWEEGAGVETVSPHGRAYAWTRKHAIRARGAVTIAGRRHVLDGAGIVDDSAGYHARHTAWHWAAGVGELESGLLVAWNLVSGIHDAPEASERSVWLAGVPHEVEPVRFAPGLRGVEFGEGGALAFDAEAARAHRENLLVVRSSYEQPFGSFTGDLPGAGTLRWGRGVMERHDVKW